MLMALQQEGTVEDYREMLIPLADMLSGSFQNGFARRVMGQAKIHQDSCNLIEVIDLPRVILYFSCFLLF